MWAHINDFILGTFDLECAALSFLANCITAYTLSPVGACEKRAVTSVRQEE
jgi:hypothetical protein